MPPKRFDPLRHMIHLVFQDVTPVRLRLLFVANCLAAFIFCFLSVSTVQQHRHAVQTIERDAAPSVISAHQINIGVEKMDADLANVLIYPPGQLEASNMEADFSKWLNSVGQNVVSAASNITYGEAELAPIGMIQSSLIKFARMAQSAFDAHAANKETDALNCYRKALNIIQSELIPQANSLNKANADQLESTYSQEESRSALSCGFLLAVGMMVSFLMISTQIYLSKRFHRRLNGPFLVATVCTMLFVQHLYVALQENTHYLKVAKEDAYDSIVALLDTRANAFAADAAESRWLLDSLHGATHEQTFMDKVASVASFAPGHNFAETIDRAQKQLAERQKYHLPGLSGSMANVLNNVRFEGEPRAALDTLEAFAEYCSLSAKMRQLEKSGSHDAAVQVALGYNPNQSKFWFTKFDDALQRTLEINQDHFEQSIKDASRDLTGLIALSEVLLALTALCIYLGLRDRMAEYV